MKDQNETTFEDMLKEFEIKVDVGAEPQPTTKFLESNDKPVESEETPKIEDGVIPEVPQPVNVESKVEEEEIPVTGESPSYYKELTSKFIEKGKWEDREIEDEEGNVVKISEMKDMDEETFMFLVDQFSEEEKKATDDKFIPKDGLDERKLKIVEILKNGGDLKEIFNTQENLQNYINPYSGVDIENESVQEQIYLNALISHNKLPQDEAVLIVEKAKKDFTLDSKVKKFVGDYNKAFDKYVEDKAVEVEQKRKQEIEKEKEFRKTLQDQYKEYGIDEKLGRSLATLATSRTKEGEYEIDLLYGEKMEDPKEAAEILLFLKDKKAYLEYKMQEVKRDVNLETRKRFKMVQGTKQAKQSTENNGNVNIEENEFSFKVK